MRDSDTYFFLHEAIRVAKLLKKAPPEFNDLVKAVKKCGPVTQEDVRLAVKAFESHFQYKQDPPELTMSQWCIFNVLELEIISR
jgi:hypothetical protein